MSVLLYPVTYSLAVRVIKVPQQHSAFVNQPHIVVNTDGKKPNNEMWYFLQCSDSVDVYWQFTANCLKMLLNYQSNKETLEHTHTHTNSFLPCAHAHTWTLASTDHIKPPRPTRWHQHFSDQAKRNACLFYEQIQTRGGITHGKESLVSTSNEDILMFLRRLQVYLFISCKPC